MPRHKRNRSSQLKPAANVLAVRPGSYAAVGLALILLTTLLVYLPALQGGRLWDDDAHITKPELQSLGGLYRIWFEPAATQQYYPLLHSAFWLEHQLWGESLLGYHLINVLWHLLAVVLVYVILTKLKIPGALLAAALFALHPVMVESVAWITEQKNTLSAVFYLSAMLVYREFDQSRRRSHYFIALGLFVLGLLTKTVTATLPAALLVIFWWQRGTLSWRRDVLPLAPFFLLGAGAGLTTAWVERTLIGAEGADFELSFVARSLLAGRAIWFYLVKLLWPANLIFIYPRWDIDPAEWWQWTFSIAALVVTVVLWVVHKRWRAPLAGWLFFCGTLFPVLGFLNVYPFIFSFVADHFQYLASLGIIVLAAAGIARGLACLSPPTRHVGTAFSILLVATLAVLSWRQSCMYADSVTLYKTTLDRNPNCWMAHDNLGMELLVALKPKEAVEHFRLSLRINPNNARAHNNLGVVLAETGQLPEAIEHYHESLSLLPKYFDAHDNLGNALANAGRLLEAIEEFHAALALKRDDPAALNNLSRALIQLGRFPEAMECLERALRQRPDYAQAHNNLGIALARNGQIPQGIEHFRQALQLNPNDVNTHKNLGLFLAEKGDRDEAIAELEQAVRLRPDLPDVRNNLGDVLRQSGRHLQAIQQYQAALRLNPDYLQAYANLALTFTLLGRSDEAIATAEQAIKVAQSAGQAAEVKRIEEWLKHYQIELRRGRDADSPSQPPPPTQ